MKDVRVITLPIVDKNLQKEIENKFEITLEEINQIIENNKGKTSIQLFDLPPQFYTPLKIVDKNKLNIDFIKEIMGDLPTEKHPEIVVCKFRMPNLTHLPELAQPKSVERVKRKRLGFFIEKKYFIRNCKPNGCIKLYIPALRNGELNPKFICESTVLGLQLTKWWGGGTIFRGEDFRCIQSKDVVCKTWNEVDKELDKKIQKVYDTIVGHLKLINDLEESKPLDFVISF